MAAVRVALVSPYSYTYPGGVGRHVEALAQELTGLGHEVRLLAPYDPDDRLARVFHRGASPQPRPLPDHVIPLGRTFGLPMNGAVTNLAGPIGKSIGVLGRELRSGNYDVVHVHEPNVPVVSWYATEAARVPVVATFHTYSTGAAVSKFTANFLGARRLYSKLSARIAVSEAAAWTAQRFYGGRYRIVPNGVDLSAARPDPTRPNEELKLLFVGRADERKGLPVLLRAFEALRGAGVQARLTVAGPAAEEVEPLLLEPEGVELAGPVDDAEKWRLLGRGGRALRSLAWRRELRHGAHRGVRLGHARRGLRHRWLPRRGAARYGQRACTHGGCRGARRGSARAGLRPRPTHAYGRGRARAGGPLRLAERGPRGHGGLRAGARGAGVRPAYDACGPARRHRARRARSARGPRAPAVTRAEGPHSGAQARGPHGAARAGGRGCRGGCGPRGPRAAQTRDPVDRARDRGGHARLGARCLRADVRLDAAPRRVVERDPARRPARHARPSPRHRARQR